MQDQQTKLKRNTPVSHYSEGFKKSVVQDYARGLLSKEQVRIKYGIGGKSQVLNWSRKYSNLHHLEKARNGGPMKNADKQRIKDQDRQIKELQLKVKAYETLIAIVKREDGIDILKKGDAKQSESLPKTNPGT
jgi:transposase